MLLWFLGPAVAIVWVVFRSPAVDNRVVALGAVLPLVEVVLGGPLLLHSLLGAVLALVVVMAATRRRRLLRRRWLGLPIGLFLHLALDGTITRSDLFWWPAFGTAFPGGPLPELDRAPLVIVVLEVVGAVASWWCWRTFGLDDRGRRHDMVRTGQVDRRLLPPAP